MQYQITPYALLPLCTAVVSAMLAYETWRRRSDPASLPFIAVTFLLSIWSFGNTFELSSANEATAFVWVRVQYIAIVGIPVFWLLMMLAFTERRRVCTQPWVLSLLVIPLITLVIVWSDSAIPFFWREFTIEILDSLTVIHVQRGPWFWVHTTYSYLMLAAGTFILFRSLLLTPGIYRDQSIALLAGASAPWVVNVLYVFNLIPHAFPDPTALAFVITGLAFSWAMRNAGLFDLGPMAYREVFLQMGDGVMVLDVRNRIVDLNRVAAHAFSRPGAQLVGQPLAQVITPWPDLIDRYRNLLSDEQITNTEIGIRVRGDLQVYDLQVTPIRGARGKLNGRMLVWRNITVLKQAMAQIQHQNEQLENQAMALLDAKVAAEAGSRAKSVFLTTMSHELRTPLSAILGYTELIRYNLAAQNKEALDKDLGNIKIAGEHLLRMIASILDYAKIDAGKMKLDLQNFPIQNVVNEALISVQPLVERNANQIDLQIALDFDSMYADSLKVRQVLINLLSNAAKFTQSGVITLRVTKCMCAHRAPEGAHGSPPSGICFEVIDTGIGMTESQISQLFQDYTQVLPTMPGQVGTGLGLALSQRLCKLMGGQIAVASQPGLGTTFTVMLPTHVAE